MGRAHLLALFVLFLVGVGTKAGLIPLHSWLPTAMIAPTPVSAYCMLLPSSRQGSLASHG
jgi:multicomponent Na+:H+ antiporter subunit D